MSSEAAQKAYPDNRREARIRREAFDAGAVEALRQAAELVGELPTGAMTGATRNQAMRSILELAQSWEMGQ